MSHLTAAETLYLRVVATRSKRRAIFLTCDVGCPGVRRGASERRAIGCISYPMRRARANICCSSGDRGGSAALCVFHCERSTIAIISSSRSSSSSNANTCSAGRWTFVVWLRLAKSVHTSMRVWSFLSFLVRITTHRDRYFSIRDRTVPERNVLIRLQQSSTI